MSERIEHPVEPIYDEESKVLILGTFPSVKSREGQFFYHHPQNRFWKVVSTIYEETIPKTIDEKKSLLIRNHIALWDVIQSCEIIGSADSSIKNVIPNDITRIIKVSKIQCIIANGSLAYKLYMKYCYDEIGTEIIQMPSTSPANASYTMDRLIEHWKYVRRVTG